jgi:hypothetical protein
MFDFGSVVPLAIAITSDGTTPADATSVTVSVTQPDGTLASPTVLHPATGSYTANFAPTQAGRHVVNWLATGTNASAYTDVFDVRAAATTAIVSLADVKSFLGVTSTSSDAELRGYIATATHIIEHEVGACSQRTVVDTFTGSWQQPYLQPRTQPVISVTSITERGTALSMGSDFLIDDFGRIIRVYGGGTSYPRGFWYGVNDIVITYVAGRRIIPSNILEAAKTLVGLQYGKKRGGVFSPFGDTNDTGAVTVLGFYVPNEVMELLTPQRDLAAGIA